MEQILTRDQISALMKKAQLGEAAIRPRAQGRKVDRFDLRQAGQPSATQTKGVSALHENFARKVSSSLSAFLRTGFEMKLASVHLVSYGDFMAGLPELTYLASLRVPSTDTRVLMQADLPIVFSMMDLVLGGTGKDQMEARELTEIEDEVFDSVMRVFAHELSAAWTSMLDFKFQFERRQQRTKAQSLTLPSEKVLALSFEVRLFEETAKVNLAFPAVISNALLRKLTEQSGQNEATASQKNQARLKELLLQSNFRLEMMLQPSNVSVREVLKLEPGSILVFKPRSTDAIQLNVEGKQMFLALPVRCGAKRGAQVHKVLSVKAKDGKETK